MRKLHNILRWIHIKLSSCFRWNIWDHVLYDIICTEYMHHFIYVVTQAHLLTSWENLVNNFEFIHMVKAFSFYASYIVLCLFKECSCCMLSPTSLELNLGLTVTQFFSCNSWLSSISLFFLHFLFRKTTHVPSPFSSTHDRLMALAQEVTGNCLHNRDQLCTLATLGSTLHPVPDMFLSLKCAIGFP